MQRKQKGQGSLEYLLLLGGGIVVSAIVVVLVLGLGTSGQEGVGSSYDIYRETMGMIVSVGSGSGGIAGGGSGEGGEYTPGDDIELEGQAESGTGPFEFQWDFDNDGEIDETSRDDDGDGISDTTVTLPGEFVSDIGDYEVTLTIVDEGVDPNESSTGTVIISISPSTPDLVYSFDGGTAGTSATGETITDEVGNLDATVAGTPEWANGVMGTGMYFRGAGSDAVEIPLSAWPGESGTIIFWANVVDNTARERVVSTEHNSGSDYELRAYRANEDADELKFIFRLTGSNSIAPGVPLPYNEWHQIAISWKKEGTSTNFTAYLDGEKTYSDSTFGTVITPNLTFNIGRWHGGCGYKGYVDEFKIYNKAITENEVSAQMPQLSIATITAPEEYNIVAGGGITLSCTDSVIREGATLSSCKWEETTGAAGTFSTTEGETVTFTPDNEIGFYNFKLTLIDSEGGSAVTNKEVEVYFLETFDDLGSLNWFNLTMGEINADNGTLNLSNSSGDSATITFDLSKGTNYSIGYAVVHSSEVAWDSFYPENGGSNYVRFFNRYNSQQITLQSQDGTQVDGRYIRPSAGTPHYKKFIREGNETSIYYGLDKDNISVVCDNLAPSKCSYVISTPVEEKISFDPRVLSGTISYDNMEIRPLKP